MSVYDSFRKLGFSYVTENEDGVSYTSDTEYDEYGNEFNNVITFWHDKNITVFRIKHSKPYGDSYEPFIITLELRKVIQMKMKELGWQQ